MTKRIDYAVGQRFGKWTIVGPVKSDGKDARWWCVCACGTKSQVIGNKLRNRISTSCGCGRTEQIAKARWTGFGELSGVHWKGIIRGARYRNLKVSITIEDAWNLFVKQKRKCALTGLPLDMYQRISKTRQKGTASLDRIDSTKGYTKNNIHWVHKHVNKMKMEFSLCYFKELCSLITNNSSR